MSGTPLACVLLLCSLSAAQDPLYNRDVRPILARNCFKCHGPDEAERKAKLRLDVPGGGASHQAILERITSKDPKHVMPPPRSGKTLTQAQVGTLRRWLEGGAPYEKHWAFVPPRRVAPPEIDADTQHPVDRFVRRALAARRMKSSPRASKTQLLRRVSLDLIGLPPSRAELPAFLSDDAPDAYERLVDRLLASPHYGERWARRWLDLARYADTNGYEKDRQRSIWPYRDWVIRAYNRDLPYDQFVIEQIAGDMLPDATEEQRIATGFHRNTMLNEEGGIDPLEYRYHALTDRVATTGSAILGLSVGCAQCHTHKFDPITHREYFGMLAFLDNADEPDYHIVSTSEREDHARRLREAADYDLAKHWPAKDAELESSFAAWLDHKRVKTSRWTPLIAGAATSNLPRLVADPKSGVINAYGDTTKHDTYRLRMKPHAGMITALRLDALPTDRLPDGGPGMTYFEGRKGDFFVSEFEVRVNGKLVRFARSTESNARPGRKNKKTGKTSPPQYRSPLAFDGNIQTGWGNTSGVGKRAVAIFELAEPIRGGSALDITLHFSRHYPASLGRFRISATRVLRGDARDTVSEDLYPLLAKGDEELSDAERAQLRRAFLLSSPPMAEHAKRIRALQRPPRRTRTLVMQERPADHRRTTHRRHRGEFLQVREVVKPHVPDVLHAMPAQLPRNRLGFARWLVSAQSPLAARVIVNRHWAALFGRGIVHSLDDFGVQGALPTHPELLDWLATQFMDKGWSIKSLHRLLVTSETYKQDARVRPEDREDLENRWLARGPRFRLEGEILRDALLHAAGLLERKMFGPPVRPPQPAGVTEVAYRQPKWHASKGKARFRRSIYTFAKRTAPFAFYETFDAPSGEACETMRDRSNTALQALTMLNDPMVLEIARASGARIAEHADAKSDADRVRFAFESLLSRTPSEAEERALSAFVEAERGRKTKDVWSALARALFALDETMTRG